MHIENVLSVFDGHSGLMISLEQAGFTVGSYFSSEIDKHAIKASEVCYPNAVRLGDVRNVNGLALPKISVYGGGSPCQSFSFAGKRNGMSTKCEIEILSLGHYLQLKSENFEFEGQSFLFWEYMRILKELQQVNPDVYFFLENVEMGAKWENVISKAIGVKGIHINSALVSAQNRRRIYWTNIGMEPGGLFGDMQSIIPQPKDRGVLLKDILESEVDEKYYLSDKGQIRHSTNLRSRLSDENEKCGALLANQYKQSTDMLCVAMRGRGENNEQQLEPRNDNKTNAITSVQKDNLIICHNTMPRDVIQLNQSKESGGKQPYQQNRIYSVDGISPALCANKSDLNIEIINPRQRANHKNENEKANAFLSTSYKGSQANGMTLVGTSRIRRLTPLECGRLQTIPEHALNTILSSGISDSQIYRMFGNGWNIETIVHILKYIKK